MCSDQPQQPPSTDAKLYERTPKFERCGDPGRVDPSDRVLVRRGRECSLLRWIRLSPGDVGLVVAKHVQ
jgi:hypothetical protein